MSGSCSGCRARGIAQLVSQAVSLLLEQHLCTMQSLPQCMGLGTSTDALGALGAARAFAPYTAAAEAEGRSGASEIQLLEFECRVRGQSCRGKKNLYIFIYIYIYGLSFGQNHVANREAQDSGCGQCSNLLRRSNPWLTPMEFRRAVGPCTSQHSRSIPQR